eukprot:scaffold368_cov258-Pinguiococcus_pyrenoidosus.AAC.66
MAVAKADRDSATLSIARPLAVATKSSTVLENPTSSPKLRHPTATPAGPHCSTISSSRDERNAAASIPTTCPTRDTRPNLTLKGSARIERTSTPAKRPVATLEAA